MKPVKQKSTRVSCILILGLWTLQACSVSSPSVKTMNSHDFFKQFSDREAYDSDFFEYAVFAYTSNQDSVRLMFPSIKDSAVIGLADTALKKEDNPELRDKRINLYTTLTAFSDTLVADKHHFIVIQKKHVGRLK